MSLFYHPDTKQRQNTLVELPMIISYHLIVKDSIFIMPFISIVICRWNELFRWGSYEETLFKLWARIKTPEISMATCIFYTWGVKWEVICIQNDTTYKWKFQRRKRPGGGATIALNIRNIYIEHVYTGPMYDNLFLYVPRALNACHGEAWYDMLPE